MHATLQLLETTDFPPIRRKRPETLQVNLGYRCNQTCVHCHVNAGPNRSEEMSRETIDEVIAFLEASTIKTLDVTGGAPELNPHFRDLVCTVRRLARISHQCVDTWAKGICEDIRKRRPLELTAAVRRQQDKSSNLWRLLSISAGGLRHSVIASQVIP